MIFWKILHNDEKITDNRKYTLTLIQVAQNQKQTSTGILIKLLVLKIDAKVMLTVNKDIQVLSN